MIFINYKTYQQGTGADAIELTRMVERVADATHIKIIPVVQSSDIKEVVSTTKLGVWTQKIDPFDFGAHTGAVLPEAVYEDGAVGTFLNHSEAKLRNFEDLKKSVKRADEVGLKTLVFAGNLEELKRILRLKPTFASYEPPELVGSKTTSVAKAKPEIISKAVKLTKEKGIPLVVGAGIKSAKDVRCSIELGCVGVAVASDVVSSSDPEKDLLDLVRGLN